MNRNRKLTISGKRLLFIVAIKISQPYRYRVHVVEMRGESYRLYGSKKEKVPADLSADEEQDETELEE